MDRNGYFFYVASTAKKKKISLMQPRPPRVAFIEDKRRPGVAERISVAPTATESGRVDPMSNRGPSPAPRARLYSQLESYQPRYHTIRDQRDRESDKKVDSECRRRKKEQRIGYQQGILRSVMFVCKVACFIVISFVCIKCEVDNVYLLRQIPTSPT